MATTTTTQIAAPTKPAAAAAVPDVKTLRDAIPARCFERSLSRSMFYVVRDLIAVSVLFLSAVWLAKLDAPWSITIPLWTLYSFVQGLFFTGLWILAHECGHDSFSPYLNVNATVGWVLHSMLMVPFFSWKFSHSRHHRYANHMQKDTVFVPYRKEELQEKKATGVSLAERFMDHSAADTPIVSFGALVFHQLFGWPAYILLNAGAGINSLTKNSRDKTSAMKQFHLNPTAHVFTDAEQPFVLLSNIGLMLVLGALYQVSKSLGVGHTFLLYGLPYLWMNHWIVAITYLHHTHPDSLHYDESNWTYAKGALSTVDREFGFIGRHIFHGIIEYHVVHHIFPRIPFYHAEEATWAIEPILGEKYIQQRSNFFVDLWTAFTTYKYVEEGSGALGSGLVWGKKATR